MLSNYLFVSHCCPLVITPFQYTLLHISFSQQPTMSHHLLSTGEIVNYMQLDTNRMEQVIGTIHVCWDGPLQVRCEYRADVPCQIPF